MGPRPPPLPSNPGAQYAQQFLSTALSQRGPSALPYSEETKRLIRQHLVALVDAFPSLAPKISSFTHDDGRSLNLLNADGTIPMSYSGSLYNIPASIWLLETYPRSPPSVLLTPTTNMVVRHHHPFVDRYGSVHAPYLRSWVYPSSNLVDLVKSLSHLFGQDPPLYSRKPSPSASPSPSPSPSISPLPSSSRIYSPPYYQPQPQPQRPAEDPAEVYRRNAISKILETVHGDMAGMRRAQEAEMEGLSRTQAELRRRAEEIGRGVREMTEEKEALEQQLEALEQQLQPVLMNTDVLEAWVRENEGKRRRDSVVDPDEVFEMADGFSRQMVECTAADLAVEDKMYSLDKAVQEGTIPFEMYLKSVRALSREQFFHRALAAKVRAAQVQMQVTSMAARAPAQNLS